MARVADLLIVVAATVVIAAPCSGQQYEAILSGANELPLKANDTATGVLLLKTLEDYVEYNLTIANILDLLVGSAVHWHVWADCSKLSQHTFPVPCRVVHRSGVAPCGRLRSLLAVTSDTD